MLAIGKEHCKLFHLQSERNVGADNSHCGHSGIVFGHHTRRNVDAHDTCRRLVDVLHERSEATLKRLVESRTEQSVYYQRLFGKFRRVEVVRHFRETMYQALADESVAVLGTLIRQMTVHVKQISINAIAFLGKHTRHRQCVAAVVARTCKHHNWGALRPLLLNGCSNGTRCTLHKINRCYGLVFYCIFIELTYLRSC